MSIFGLARNVLIMTGFLILWTETAGAAACILAPLTFFCDMYYIWWPPHTQTNKEMRIVVAVSSVVAIIFLIGVCLLVKDVFAQPSMLSMGMLLGGAVSFFSQAQSTLSFFEFGERPAQEPDDRPKP